MCKLKYVYVILFIMFSFKMVHFFCLDATVLVYIIWL